MVSKCLNYGVGAITDKASAYDRSIKVYERVLINVGHNIALFVSDRDGCTPNSEKLRVRFVRSVMTEAGGTAVWLPVILRNFSNTLITDFATQIVGLKLLRCVLLCRTLGTNIVCMVLNAPTLGHLLNSYLLKTDKL